MTNQLITNDKSTNYYSIHWFRRDLRLDDNAALYHALKSGFSVLPIFIFDTEILDDLKNENSTLTLDRRVVFIHQQLQKLKNELNVLGSDLLVFYGKPADVWKEIVSIYNIKKVFTNNDYEPYSNKRDHQLKHFLLKIRLSFFLIKTK